MRFLILLAVSLLTTMNVCASAPSLVRIAEKGTPAKRVSPWVLVKKNEWRAHLDDGDASEVTLRLYGKETVIFKVLQKCHGKKDAREQTSIEWRYRLPAVREPCTGNHEYTDEGLRELEKNLAPYPPEVEAVLNPPKPKLKTPRRPPIEDMLHVQPIHEARRANAPAFFMQSKRAPPKRRP